MTTEDDFRGIVNKIIDETEGPIDNIPAAPETIAKQKHDSSAGAGSLEFRPLTEEEKEEFVNSLNATGKQIYAELAGKAKTKRAAKTKRVRSCRSGVPPTPQSDSISGWHYL